MLSKHVEALEGLYVGLLTERELRDFERAVAAGVACRSYEGAGGFLGLARVRIASAARSREAEMTE